MYSMFQIRRLARWSTTSFWSQVVTGGKWYTYDFMCTICTNWKQLKRIIEAKKMSCDIVILIFYSIMTEFLLLLHKGDMAASWQKAAFLFQFGPLGRSWHSPAPPNRFSKFRRPRRNDIAVVASGGSGITTWIIHGRRAHRLRLRRRRF